MILNRGAHLFFITELDTSL